MRVLVVGVVLLFVHQPTGSDASLNGPHASGGAIGLLMGMLTNLTTKKSADYAAKGLAALAEKCHENTTGT